MMKKKKMTKNKLPPKLNEYLERLKKEEETKDKCIRCGSPLEPNYNYCPRCGNGIENLIKRPSVKWSYVCQICGFEIGDMFGVFCPNCGQRIRHKEEFENGTRQPNIDRV